VHCVHVCVCVCGGGERWRGRIGGMKEGEREGEREEEREEREGGEGENLSQFMST